MKDNIDKNTPLKITLKEYGYSCGDGCCYNYGTITTVNGVELPFGGNGDYYINLVEYDEEGHFVKSINYRMAMSGGFAPHEVKMTFAALYRAMEAAKLNEHPANESEVTTLSRNDDNTILPAVPFRAKDKTNAAYKNIVVTKVKGDSVVAHSTFADGYRKYERDILISDIELIPEHKCDPDSFNKHCQTCGRYCS